MLMSKFSNSDIYKILSIIFSNNIKYEKNVLLPYTNCTLDLITLLVRSNQIAGVQIKCIQFFYYILITLSYLENKSKILNLYFISKPGRRIYVNLKEIMSIVRTSPAIFFILYSSYGLISCKEALMLRTGGELICILN